MEKRDRFLLETYMMQCWHITDDIDTLTHYISEKSNIPATEQDKLLNMLMGMKELYHWKFERMMDLFSEMIKNGHIERNNVY